MRIIDVLKNAVEKAEVNGYKNTFDFVYGKGGIIDKKAYYAILFDKDFCKAIWGEEEKFLPYLYTHPHLGENKSLWEWHIKQMILSNNPIEYLERNLDRDSWSKVYSIAEEAKLQELKEKIATLRNDSNEIDGNFVSFEWAKKNILNIK